MTNNLEIRGPGLLLGHPSKPNSNAGSLAPSAAPTPSFLSPIPRITQALTPTLRDTLSPEVGFYCICLHFSYVSPFVSSAGQDWRGLS